MKEVTSSNFWEMYGEIKASAYKKHWKEHPVKNILSLLVDCSNLAIKSFFIYGIASLGLSLALIGYFDGVMSAVNIVEEIITEIKEGADTGHLVSVWFYSSMFFYITFLIFYPIRSPAQKASEQEQDDFFQTYKHLMPSTFLRPLGEENNEQQN